MIDPLTRIVGTSPLPRPTSRYFTVSGGWAGERAGAVHPKRSAAACFGSNHAGPTSTSGRASISAMQAAARCLPLRKSESGYSRHRAGQEKKLATNSPVEIVSPRWRGKSICAARAPRKLPIQMSHPSMVLPVSVHA
ncbi:hypothetical protein EQG66_11805 [Sphingobium fluviale]|uniref:Uncharacterized protein n=1 Tax=Sphingobium fluviale TaxID=2506423 RepID=A0A4V1N3A6_9SPHN|nr:hypothetical protein EQG66_11805 [Sphingobium fluviale]